MNIKEARLLFHTGVLQEPVIRKEEGGWIVLLEGNHPLNPVLETARGQVRVFRTVDAAVEVLFELGFNSIRVIR